MITFPHWRAAGRAMRWARRHHGARLSVDVVRYDDGRRRYGWTLDGTDAVLSIQTGPNDHDIHLFAAGQTYRVHMDTADTTRILDVLVALGLLFREYSSVFHRGQLAGRADLARELADDLATCEIVEQAGREAGQAVMDQ